MVLQLLDWKTQVKKEVTQTWEKVSRNWHLTLSGGLSMLGCQCPLSGDKADHFWVLRMLFRKI